MADGIYRDAGRREPLQLDERRRTDARKRLAEALRDAAYHDRQAAGARARAEQIARTWQLEVPANEA